MPRRSSSHRSRTAARVMTLDSPAQYKLIERLIRQGPATLILVYSPSCPHCHTYMPLWKELGRLSKKQANMVTMRADVYEQTPLSERQSVTGVPSVLYVDPAGTVSEVEDIRNTTKMTNLITTGSATGNVNSETLLEMATSTTESRSAAVPSAPMPEVIPGQTSSPNPLPPLPGMTSSEQRGGRRHRRLRQTLRHRQVGGNPWAAFLASAGPAAVLAGAYAALPARSSGLPAPQHSAKWRRIRARLTRRRRH
jgi:hypothetical protein